MKCKIISLKQNLKNSMDSNNNLINDIMDQLHQDQNLTQDQIDLLWDIKTNAHKSRKLLNEYRIKNNLDFDFNLLE